MRKKGVEVGLTTEFPNLGILRNFADFYSENFRKKMLIPNDSEHFGIVYSEVGTVCIGMEFRQK